jgi:mycofactocin precursor
MSPRNAAPATGPESTQVPGVTPEQGTTTTDERYLLEEELVDEISIDGMCGVY